MKNKELKIQYLLYLLIISLLSIHAGCDADSVINPAVSVGDSISGTITFVDNEPEANGNYMVLAYDFNSWPPSGIPIICNVNPVYSGNKYKCNYKLSGLQNASNYRVCLVFIKNNLNTANLMGLYDCGTSTSCLSYPPGILVPGKNKNFEAFLAMSSALMTYPYWGLSNKLANKIPD